MHRAGCVMPGAPLVYDLGVFAGAGVDAGAPRGDVDSGKEVAFREPGASVTKRFESRGTITPTFESNVWRWTVDPVLTTRIDTKARGGGEVHWLRGPLTTSAELAVLRWSGIEVLRGPETLLRTSGEARTASVWASVIDTSEPLFEKRAGVSVLEGARRMGEVTLGASWTLAYAMRLQANVAHTWVPDARRDGGIVSGASSEASDPSRKNVLVPSETMIGARVIFRI